MKLILCYLHASGRYQFTSLAKDCRQFWEPCMKGNIQGIESDNQKTLSGALPHSGQ